jgi:hypothetical protein
MLVSSTDMNMPMTTMVSGRPHLTGGDAAGEVPVVGLAGGVVRGVPPLRADPGPASVTATRAPVPALVPVAEPVSVCGLVSVRVPLPAMAGAALVPERDI